jgi:Asp-tRNA(Asn)/Glu-tRNA(Gln) amidotransferase A subunit family amidase
MRILMGTYALSAGYYDAYYKRAQQVTFRKVACNANLTFLLFYLLTDKVTL